MQICMICILSSSHYVVSSQKPYSLSPVSAPPPKKNLAFATIIWVQGYQNHNANDRPVLACKQQTYFRTSLLSLRKRERSDDRKYVCCSQAKPVQALDKTMFRKAMRDN